MERQHKPYLFPAANRTSSAIKACFAALATVMIKYAQDDGLVRLDVVAAVLYVLPLMLAAFLLFRSVYLQFGSVGSQVSKRIKFALLLQPTLQALADFEQQKFRNYVSKLNDFDYLALARFLDIILATGFGLQPKRRLAHRLIPTPFIVASPASIADKVGMVHATAGVELLGELQAFVAKGSGRTLFDVFAEADVDGSHELEVEELTAAIQKIKPDVSEADCKAVFDLIDADGSGSITLEELTGVLRLYNSGIFTKLSASGVMDGSNIGTKTEKLALQRLKTGNLGMLARELGFVEDAPSASEAPRDPAASEGSDDGGFEVTAPPEAMEIGSVPHSPLAHGVLTFPAMGDETSEVSGDLDMPVASSPVSSPVFGASGRYQCGSCTPVAHPEEVLQS